MRFRKELWHNYRRIKRILCKNMDGCERNNSKQTTTTIIITELLSKTFSADSRHSELYIVPMVVPDNRFFQ
jgi:hypothetical protein